VIDKDQPQDSEENVEEPLSPEDAATAENEAIDDASVAAQDHKELTKLLEDARAKADEHWDQVVRMRAEIDNLRKRNQRDLESAHKYALEKISQDMLQVWDSLELGFQAAQDEGADINKIREGTELTLKLLVDVMSRHGIEQVNPEGKAFDPEFHQAMSMQERNDVEPNTVVAVVQKGYLLNGRLLRPAMVLVSKASSGEAIDEQA
jgi:molecular chaperone GrpE